MLFNPKWTEYRPSDPNAWEQFMPPEEIDRMQAWEHNKALLRGWQADVFKDIDTVESRLEIAKVNDVMTNARERACLLYIVANYCGLLSRTVSSLLFGEAIKVTPTNGDSDSQHLLNQIMANNELQRLNLMQARTSSAYGYSYYRVRWGRKHS